MCNGVCEEGEDIANSARDYWGGGAAMTLRLILSFIEASLMTVMTQEDKGHFQGYQPVRDNPRLVRSPALFHLSPASFSNHRSYDPHILTALVIGMECKELSFLVTGDANFPLDYLGDIGSRVQSGM